MRTKTDRAEFVLVMTAAAIQIAFILWIAGEQMLGVAAITVYRITLRFG